MDEVTLIFEPQLSNATNTSGVGHRLQSRSGPQLSSLSDSCQCAKTLTDLSRVILDSCPSAWALSDLPQAVPNHHFRYVAHRPTIVP